MKQPFDDWSTASRKFGNHESRSEIHKTAVLTMQSFQSVMENEITPINQMQDQLLQDTVTKNRQKLESIVKSVIFHGRQNFSFRGHRDDTKYYDTADCGNFQAFLDFRVGSGDTVLEEHFIDSPKNAT